MPCVFVLYVVSCICAYSLFFCVRLLLDLPSLGFRLWLFSSISVYSLFVLKKGLRPFVRFVDIFFSFFLLSHCLVSPVNRKKVISVSYSGP